MSWRNPAQSSHSDIIKYMTHSIGSPVGQCRCPLCIASATRIKELLGSVWHKYPFDDLQSTECAGFQETLVDTDPDYFKLEFCAHGAGFNVRRCCLTGAACLAYYVMSSSNPEECNTRGCENCNGVLACVNGRKRRADNSYVISEETGRLLTHIRFLSNLQQFMKQARQSDLETLKLHVILSKKSLETFVNH